MTVQIFYWQRGHRRQWHTIRLEVEEITAGTKALVCNFGAIADYEADGKGWKSGR